MKIHHQPLKLSDKFILVIYATEIFHIPQQKRTTPPIFHKNKVGIWKLKHKNFDYENY